MRALALGAALVLAAPACSNTHDDLHPVGNAAATTAEIERFVRRLHLDLAGAPPTDEALAAGRDRIIAGANATAVRRALAEELIAQPAFAELYIAELENRAYGGDTTAGRYDFVCGIIRNDAPCDTCGPPPPDDYCAACSCPQLVTLEAERQDLAQARADLAAGATTSSIERRYARTEGFRSLAVSVEDIAITLYEAFLGRTPMGEELENAAAMAAGALGGGPAGLLYHAHGSDYADLIEIVFGSEVYREAMVGGAFARYLGRPPSSPELRHFTALLDPADPDLRPVILAITTSREYFQP